VFPAITSRVVSVVAAALLPLRAPVFNRPFIAPERLLWQRRWNADEGHLLARTGQDVTDTALTAPPFLVAPPCLFCTRCMVILFDSTQAGPNVRRSLAAARPRPFGFLPNRHRAAVECSAFVRPPCWALPTLSFSGNHFGDRRHQLRRHHHYGLVTSSKRRFIFGYGFVFCLRLIMQE
jgi:hypothetical protein